MNGTSGMIDPPEDFGTDEALAMDVALGALGREDLRAAERRMRSDPAFRALVEGWQTTLSPLAEGVAPLAPPASVWDSIAAEIAPAPVGRTAVRPERTASWWNSLALWRGLALGGGVAAAIALTPLVTPGAAPAKAQVLVATLAATDGTPLIAAAYDPARGAVVLAPANHRDDPGKSAELWVIEGKNPPRSLGVIDPDKANTHVIPPAKIAGLKPGSTLAISIEPLGGSPTGQPTGPVVATGTLTAV